MARLRVLATATGLLIPGLCCEKGVRSFFSSTVLELPSNFFVLTPKAFREWSVLWLSSCALLRWYPYSLLNNAKPDLRLFSRIFIRVTGSLLLSAILCSYRGIQMPITVIKKVPAFPSDDRHPPSEHAWLLPNPFTPSDGLLPRSFDATHGRPRLWCSLASRFSLSPASGRGRVNSFA